MIWQFVAGALAAAGLVLFLWCLIGCFLLPAAAPGLSAVYRCRGDAPALEQTVRSFAWLRETGLTGMPLVIVDCGLSAAARARAERLAAARPYLEIRTEKGQTDDGTPTGADPRQRGLGGIPE